MGVMGWWTGYSLPGYFAFHYADSWGWPAVYLGMALMWLLLAALAALVQEFGVAQRIVTARSSGGDLRLWHGAGTALVLLQWGCALRVLTRLVDEEDLFTLLAAAGLLAVLAGCENSATSYMIDGSQHALILVREQKFVWDDELRQAVVVSRLPACQKRTERRAALGERPRT